MKNYIFEDSTLIIQPIAKIAHKLFEKHPSMMIEYYNMWRLSKITKAFLTAMKKCIFDHTIPSKKKAMKDLFYGLHADRLKTTLGLQSRLF